MRTASGDSADGSPGLDEQVDGVRAFVLAALCGLDLLSAVDGYLTG